MYKNKLANDINNQVLNKNIKQLITKMHARKKCLSHTSCIDDAVNLLH